MVPWYSETLSITLGVLSSCNSNTKNPKSLQHYHGLDFVFSSATMNIVSVVHLELVNIFLIGYDSYIILSRNPLRTLPLMEFQFTSDICAMLHLSNDGIPFRMIRSLEIVPYLILEGYNDFKGWEGLHQPTSSPLNSLTPTSPSSWRSGNGPSQDVWGRP